MYSHIQKIISSSLESKFATTAKEYNKRGESIISLGLGEPSFNTPKKIISKCHQAMLSGYTRYSNPKGLYKLRSKIKKKLWNENKIRVKPENIIVTPGAKMALSLALMSVLRDGDEVINFFPCYPSYTNQIFLANSKVKIKNFNLNKNNFAIDFKKLKKIFSSKTRAVILNFPNNPTGKVLNNEEITKLKKIFSKQKCWLILDEIYEHLNFSKSKHFSFSSDNILKKRCITINGFSKSHSMTGWRIGYLAATDDKIIKIINKIHQNLNTNVAPFIQYAALECLSMDKRHLDIFNNKMKNNHNYLIKRINDSKLFSLVSSQGALFAFLNISKTKIRSDNFCNIFLKKFKVATIPGLYFGKNWNDHVRISLVEKNEIFKEGIKRLMNFEKTLLKNKK
tara:strand:- start:11786 stop:12970 length:1185 start_codon:yes stop_codon:yes gene_type:complete